MRAFAFLASLILVLFTACETPRMEGYEVHGIDVSHYQFEIDWPRVAEQEVHFAFMKATEGVSLKDGYFQSNWKAARAAGIICGAYHYLVPGIDPLKQAENFMETVQLEPGDLPPVLDVEVSAGQDSEAVYAAVKQWITAIETKYKIKPIIYTGLNFYHEHLAGKIDEHRVWIARYNTITPNLGRQWDFWQYTNRGGLDGIDGRLDLNVYQGQLATLKSLCVPQAAAANLLEP